MSISARRMAVDNTKRLERTHELAECPKYFERPVLLMDRVPKASTSSGLGSSSLIASCGLCETSLCSGALILNSSSESRGCDCAEICPCEARKPSSSSRTRVASSEIFSCSSWVEANTNLEGFFRDRSSAKESKTYLFPCPVVKEPYRSMRFGQTATQARPTSGQMAPQPRLRQELHGIERSHLSLSLDRWIRPSVPFNASGQRTVCTPHN